MDYLIDVTGTCNLRCPSCPVGNFEKNEFIATPRPKGFMDFSYFSKLLEKIIEESKNDTAPPEISLYNWGESLIHPEIHKIMDLLNVKNISFNISSNLNSDIDLKLLIKARPKMFRVSLSGGFNSTYQKGHKGGDINLVISNLYKIKYLSEKMGVPTNIHVFYHVYRDNCDDDLLKMFNICCDLDIPFIPGVAYFMPIEKIMYRLTNLEKFTAQDQKTMDRMWISIEESLEIAKRSSNKNCILQENQIVVNYDGAVPICCGVYDPAFFVANDYLQVARDELMEKRKNYEFCAKCIDYGINNVLVYNPQQLWDAAVVQKQKDAGVKILTRMFSHPALTENI